jgi:hypothetical protein
VGKCTESATGAVAGVLDIVALGGFVYLRVELLLCPAIDNLKYLMYLWLYVLPVPVLIRTL